MVRATWEHATTVMTTCANTGSVCLQGAMLSVTRRLLFLDHDSGILAVNSERKDEAHFVLAFP